MSIDNVLFLPIKNIIVPSWKVLEYDSLLTWLEIKTILLEIHEVTLVETFTWVIKNTQLQAFDKAKCFGKLYAFKLQGIK